MFVIYLRLQPKTQLQHYYHIYKSLKDRVFLNTYCCSDEIYKILKDSSDHYNGGKKNQFPSSVPVFIQNKGWQQSDV